MSVVVATGGFDPIHSGHIQYLKEAKKHGDILLVGLNSDNWLVNKKGRAFMTFQERAIVLENMSFVDKVLAIDDSTGDASDAIRQARELYPDEVIFFVNGGDRNQSNVPEQTLFPQDDKLFFNFGIGGVNKLNSSSRILEEWTSASVTRPWGRYRVLKEFKDNLNHPTTKVKELVIEPHKSISMQRHLYRSEHWFVALGQASLYTLDNQEVKLVDKYSTHDHIHVDQDKWHKLANESDMPLHIVEIQYGYNCTEEDIERHD